MSVSRSPSGSYQHLANSVRRLSLLALSKRVEKARAVMRSGLVAEPKTSVVHVSPDDLLAAAVVAPARRHG